jgi:hypothetical protein
MKSKSKKGLLHDLAVFNREGLNHIYMQLLSQQIHVG